MRRLLVPLLAVGLVPTVAQGAAALPDGKISDLASPVLVALTILALGVGVTATALVTHLVLPGVSRRSALLVRRTPGRSLVYGVLALLIVFLGLILAKGVSPVLAKLLVVVLGVPCTVFGLVGTTAACYSLGESLLTGAGSPHHDSGPWAVGVGAALLSLANLFPVVGQAICLLAVLTGLGAVVRQVLTRPPAPDAIPPTAGP